MKIIHTSDWHLGHILYKYSREEEQSDMLNQMVELVKNHKPDAFLISGDVYDTMQPSASVQRMFTDALVKIHEAHPRMHIICIAGNHDSGSRHMIFHTPWKALNVHMVGSISKDSNIEEYIFRIEDKGYIAAVPFVADRFMPKDLYTDIYDTIAKENKQQLPVFLMAHLAVANSDFRGHEMSSAENIGGLNCQEADTFGDGYDYVALGHIHKQQKLDSDGHICYSGTPIAISFDEVYSGNKHGVMLVECNGHKREVDSTLLPIRNIRPLINIPHNGHTDWEDAKKKLCEFCNDTDNIPAYIRLNVEVDDYLPTGAINEINHIIQGRACRFCLINSKRKEHTSNTKTKTFTPSEFKTLDVIEVAQMWIEAKGYTFDSRMKEIIEEVKQDLKMNPDKEQHQ